MTKKIKKQKKRTSPKSNLTDLKKDQLSKKCPVCGGRSCSGCGGVC